MNKKIITIGKTVAKKVGLTQEAIAIQRRLDKIGKKKKIYSIDSVYNYCSKKGLKITDIYQSHDSEVVLPLTWGIAKQEEIRKVNIPKIYRADLKNTVTAL